MIGTMFQCNRCKKAVIIEDLSRTVSSDRLTGWRTISTQTTDRRFEDPLSHATKPETIELCEDCAIAFRKWAKNDR